MLVDDQLKNTVRHHLTNWKTLRGVTPFYSKMFWPPVNPELTAAEEQNERLTEFPSVELHVEGTFTEDQIKRAQEEYPHHTMIIGALKRLCNHPQLPPAAEISLRPTSGGDVAFNLIKKAYELEAKAAKSQSAAWSPLEMVKFALKLKEFSEVLSSPITIDITQGVSFSYEQGHFRSYSRGTHLRRGDFQKALQVIAKHAMPPGRIRTQHDFAAFAADIASQGYDAVFAYDEMENGLCSTGLAPIKSIRAMDKHLGGTMPVNARKAIDDSTRRWSLRTAIRPFVKAAHGIRVFVVGGEIVAATAQIERAKPGHQTEPFTAEVGNTLRAAHNGAYKTHFEESSVQPELFKQIMEKGNAVAADLKNVGQNHYAMDLLLDADGNYVIDIFGLGTADYFGLSPAVVAHAIQAMALRDMTVGVPSSEKFDTRELSKLASLPMKAVKYIEKEPSREEGSAFGGRTPSFSSIVENTARIRELLQLNVTIEQEQPNEDEIWLAEHLAISEDRRKEFDLRGFVEGVRRDFRERFPGNIDDLWNPGSLFQLVPLLDAARWFKDGQRQTWRYCLSNECDKTVTVRPIDSAPSRSERRSAPEMLDPFTRGVTDQYRDGSFVLYDADAHSSGFMQNAGV